MGQVVAGQTVEPIDDTETSIWCDACEQFCAVRRPFAIYPPLHAVVVTFCSRCGTRTTEKVRR